MRKLFSLLALLALLSTPAHAINSTTATASARNLEGFWGPENLVLNPGMEQAGSSLNAIPKNWTAGGTSARFSSGSYIGRGSWYLAWVPTAANQTLASDAVTVPPGHKGRNGVISCLVAPGGSSQTTALSMQVYDGTNVLATTSVSYLPTLGYYTRVSLNFVFPTSGTVALRFTNTSYVAAESFNIDDCFMGLAEGFNVGTLNNTTPFTSYTATLTGLGTSTTTVWYRRLGDSLEGFGSVTAGTVAASLASVTLPTGLAIDTAKLNIANTSSNPGHVVGTYAGSGNSGSAGHMVTATGTSTTLVYFSNIFSGNASTTPANGSTIFVNSAVVSFWFKVPIAGWNAETAYRPDESPASWSGYTAGITNWSTTSTTMTDPTASGTPTLTERQNRNFGTVSQAGSNYPGITFNPPRAGRYWVCATPTTVAANTAGKQAFVSLYDGTNTLATGQQVTPSSATSGAYVPIPLCSVVNFSSTASVTLRIRAAAESGSTTYISNFASSLVNAIEWSIVQLDTPMPAPLLAGSVTSNSTGLERVESAEINCDASSVATSQSGSWISSVGNRSGAGCALTIASGIFTTLRACVVTVKSATVQATSASIASATSVTIYGPSADYDAYVICMGVR